MIQLLIINPDRVLDGLKDRSIISLAIGCYMCHEKIKKKQLVNFKKKL